MKKKWILIGGGLTAFLFIVGGITVWLISLAFVNLKNFTQDKIAGVEAISRTECLVVAKNLFASDPWISNPPIQNLKTLKEACFPEAKNDEAVPV